MRRRLSCCSSPAESEGKRRKGRDVLGKRGGGELRLRVSQESNRRPDRGSWASNLAPEGARGHVIALFAARLGPGCTGFPFLLRPSPLLLYLYLVTLHSCGAASRDNQ